MFPKFFFLPIFIFFYLSSITLFSKEIIVYGESSCNHCNDFKTNLVNSDIKFTYHELSNNPAKIEEMRKHARTLNPKISSVPLPLVILESKVFIRPNFSEFIKRIHFSPHFKSFSQRNKITIYSVLESPETARLIENFQARGMLYEFKNASVRESENEIREKLEKKKLENTYKFPIVEIRDNIFQGASFKDLSSIIK